MKNIQPTTVEYIQRKVDYFKAFRGLHEDMNEDVCIACDMAIEHLERVIEKLNEPTEEQYEEASLQRRDDNEAREGMY